MAIAASLTFNDWLKKKLRELNTDENVFGSYIIGVLDEDESDEEKSDVLESLLSEIIESNLSELIQEIFVKWHECHGGNGIEERKPAELAVDVNEQLSRLLEVQKLSTVKERQQTDEERKMKEQILAKYSQTEENDFERVSSEEETVEQITAKSSTKLEPNTNAQQVLHLQKQKRDQARLDSAAKKQKDKEDREKQKQLREQKKDKRKTVKGERRR